MQPNNLMCGKGYSLELLHTNNILLDTIICMQRTDIVFIVA